MMTLGSQIPLFLALFGGSGGETLVIFLVVLILFGAKRLPEIAQQLGKSLNEFRKAARDVIDEEIMSQAPKKDAKGSNSSSSGGEQDIYKPYDYYNSYENSGEKPYHHPDEYLDPGAYLPDHDPTAGGADAPAAPSVEQAPYSEGSTPTASPQEPVEADSEPESAAAEAGSDAPQEKKERSEEP